jgi:hypothetical protein
MSGYLLTKWHQRLYLRDAHFSRFTDFILRSLPGSFRTGKISQNPAGKWIVLLADHQWKNGDQRQIYGRMQDSVIGARTLKLVTFFDKGSFQQIDCPELPLKFYQHAMGTLPFDEKSDFVKLFYNIEQSKQAYTYLKRKVYDLGDRYPGKGNFVAEYASFMAIMAKEVTNEK